MKPRWSDEPERQQATPQTTFKLHNPASCVLRRLCLCHKSNACCFHVCNLEVTCVCRFSPYENASTFLYPNLHHLSRPDSKTASWRAQVFRGERKAVLIFSKTSPALLGSQRSDPDYFENFKTKLIQTMCPHHKNSLKGRFKPEVSLSPWTSVTLVRKKTGRVFACCVKGALDVMHIKTG